MRPFLETHFPTSPAASLRHPGDVSLSRRRHSLHALLPFEAHRLPAGFRKENRARYTKIRQDISGRWIRCRNFKSIASPPFRSKQ
jgi:hypothetical protein